MRPMKSPNEGRIHTPMSKGKGKAGPRADSGTATGTSGGGGTKRIDHTKGQHLKRSSGSFSAYKK